MTDEELDAIEARAVAATKGPWVTAEYAVGDEFSIGRMGGYWLYATTDRHEARLADAAFVVAARTDIPLLVTELRVARARLKAAEALIDEWREFALTIDSCARVDVLSDELEAALRGGGNG